MVSVFTFGLAAFLVYVLCSMRVTGPGYPGSGNVFIPQVTANMIVGFSRNVKSFRLPQYIKITKSPRTEGKYITLTAKQAARIVNQQDFTWPDGTPRPTGEKNAESFTYTAFNCERRDYPFGFGEMTTMQADWQIIQQHAQIVAQQCMTARTMRFADLAGTSGNWPTGHTDTATNVAGGKFDVGASTTPYIKKGLNAAAKTIHKKTLGAVQPSQLMIVMNPNEACLWAQSPEIHDYVKSSPFAQAELAQANMNANKWGLPSTIYGYPIVVEDAVKIAYRKEATETYAYAWPDATVMMCARQGELEGVYGGGDFSTLTMFWWNDEFTVEAFNDPKNRRTEGHVVECTAEKMTAGISGYLFTSTSG